MSKEMQAYIVHPRLPARRWTAWACAAIITIVLVFGFYLLGPFAVIAVTGAIVLLLALLRAPWLGVLMLVASVPAQEFGALQAGDQSLTLTRAMFPLAIAGYVISLAIKRDVVSGTRITALFAAYVGVMILSLGWADSMSSAGAEIGRWITALLSFIILVHFLIQASERRVILFVAAIALGGVFEATFGVTQSFLAIGPASFRVGDAGSRAFGTFGQPNSYAGYLEIVLFPVAWMSIYLLSRIPGSYRSFRQTRPDGMVHSRAERIRLGADILIAALFVSATVIILSGILASYSRGAWLGVAAGGIVTVLLYHRRARVAVLLLAPLVAVVLFGGFSSIVPQAISERLTTGFEDIRPFDASRRMITDDNFAASERMAHWQAGWRMFTDQPLTGVGAGNFNDSYPEYYVRGLFQDSRGHAHNYYIHVLSEVGLPGLALYLALVGSIASLALFVLLSAPHGFERMLTLGAFGTIVSAGVHNVFENLHVLNLSIQIGLVWALVIVGHRRWRAAQLDDDRLLATEINS